MKSITNDCDFNYYRAYNMGFEVVDSTSPNYSIINQNDQQVYKFKVIVDMDYIALLVPDKPHYKILVRYGDRYYQTFIEYNG